MTISAIYQTELSDIDRDELVHTFCSPQFGLLLGLTIKSIQEQLLSLDEDSDAQEVGAQYKNLKRELAIYREFEELVHMSKSRIDSWKER